MAEAGWLVVTGAASGIMEAGHRGAGREASMGLNIMLPFEQSANPVIAGDPKLVHMKYFFTRKLMFVKECDAVVCLPGGFGTLDEAMEVITLLQTGKRDMVPVVLLDRARRQLLAGPARLRQQAPARGRHDLARGPAPLQADRQLRGGPRRSAAVLPRLSQHAVREARPGACACKSRCIRSLLEAINREFVDLLTEGDFEQREALPLERDEADLARFPRLVFRFNRRSLGRLRDSHRLHQPRQR